MPRSPLAYLLDIVEACAAIDSALSGLDLGAYRANRLVRSAVEREFILIGEAVASLIRLEPGLSERISHSRRIIGFRNQLAHDYAAVNDTVVWAIASGEVPVLREECQAILAERDASGEIE
ncbi:MAG: hypothetical protein QOJ16_2222 [Acidobacteriota bacterium]|jgi:uncharacterized protein with HEPN domain|nr:hypothetical protein [Acidobacteriota bacterium]